MRLRVARDFRTRRFWRTYALHTFSAAGVIATALQAFDVVWPDAVAKSDQPVVAISAAIAIAFGTAASWPRPVRQAYPLANTEIRIVEGDLFDQDTNLTIGMSNTFDTETPHVISEQSVQGQLLHRVYHGDLAALDSDLSTALARAEPTGTIGKPGRTDVYAVGTVASIRHQRRFLLLPRLHTDERDERGTCHRRRHLAKP